MPARGVSLEQDSRFKNKEEELLKSTKFPSVFSSKVDMSKVSLPVLRPWIEVRVEQMMGFEDDVLVEFVMGLLEQEQVRKDADAVARSTQDADFPDRLP